MLNRVAFCNEHAKLDHWPTNEGATIAWERALQRCGYELRDKSGALKDWLVGQVIVSFGDQQFMSMMRLQLRACWGEKVIYFQRTHPIND